MVIETAEFIASKDRFGHAMISKGIYSAADVDTQWTNPIREAYMKWLDNNPQERKFY
jgi:hypothetical protein